MEMHEVHDELKRIVEEIETAGANYAALYEQWNALQAQQDVVPTQALAPELYIQLNGRTFRLPTPDRPQLEKIITDATTEVMTRYYRGFVALQEFAGKTIASLAAGNTSAQ